MTFDIGALRRDTPACRNVIHLSNASSSPMPRPVLDAITQQLDREASYGTVESAETARPALERVYRSAARLLGCAEDEVALAESQSRAFHLALGGVTLREGDRVLTSASVWGGLYANLQAVTQRTGASLEIIPADEHGQADPRSLAAMLDARVRLVVLSWVPANGGVIHPVAEIGGVLAGSNALYVVDAAQAIGQMPIDVRAIGCDVLTASGRKWLRGPRGTALLYVRRAALDRLAPPLLDVFSAPWNEATGYGVRPDARRYETLERPVALQLGLGAAIDYALALGLPAIAARVQSLAERARAQLAELAGVTVRDLGTGTRAGLVTFTVEGVQPAAVKTALARANIHATATGVAYTPLDMQARGLSGLVRLAPHYFNIEDEIDRAVAVVASL